MFTRKWLVVLIVLAFSLILVPQNANAQQPSTYAALNVTGAVTGTPAVGADFTTDMKATIKTFGPGLIGIEVFLAYSVANVEPVDTDPATTGVQPAVVPTDFFGDPTPAANEVIIAKDTVAPGLAAPGRSCPLNTYPCVHVSVVGLKSQTDRTGVIAHLHWRGKTVGATTFAVLNPVVAGPPYPAQPRTAFSDADGYLIPINSIEVANFNIVIPGRVGGIALRQGVPPSVPSTGTQGCAQIQATNGTVDSGPAFTVVTNGVSATFPPQINTSGGFIVFVQAGAAYTVTASYRGYLQSQKAGVFVSGGDVLIGSTRLYGGDVNGDNVINILDIVKIIGNLGTAAVPVGSTQVACGPFEGTQGGAGTIGPPDSPFDINDDGVVDISDLSIAAGNFGKTGPTPWGQ